MKTVLKFLLLLLLPLKLMAASIYTLNSQDDVVGINEKIIIQPGDTLYKLARAYNVGFQEILAANPTIDANHIIAGKKLLIPGAHVLPAVARSGIVINLAELRLYYYQDANTVVTLPIAIGRQGWETPITKTKVIDKVESPFWKVPKSIQEYSKSQGKILPDIVEPGPQNPLGQYALRLALPSYLIHGTNDPSSIGKNISSGCIRLYPEDIEYLFYNVPVGTAVNIIDEPVKIGWHEQKIYLESHHLKNETLSDNKVLQELQNSNYSSSLNWNTVHTLLEEHSGIPTIIYGDEYEIL